MSPPAGLQTKFRFKTQVSLFRSESVEGIQALYTEMLNKRDNDTKLMRMC